MEDNSHPFEYLQYLDEGDLDDLENSLLARRQVLSLKPIYPPPGYKYPYHELNMIEDFLKRIANVRLVRQGGDF